jgi:hypothetical protein
MGEWKWPRKKPKPKPKKAHNKEKCAQIASHRQMITTQCPVVKPKKSGAQIAKSDGYGNPIVTTA